MAQFSTKTEDAPAKIDGEDAHGGFFNSRGLTYQHAVHKKVKIDAAYYCGVLQQLQQATYPNEEARVGASMDFAPR